MVCATARARTTARPIPRIMCSCARARERGEPKTRQTTLCKSSRCQSGLLGRLGQLPMRIDDEFGCGAGVEVIVAFRRLLEIDYLYIDDLGDRQLFPEDRLHELPVVFQHRRLAGMEAVGLCPAETETQAEVTRFGCLFLGARVVCHIQPGDD